MKSDLGFSDRFVSLLFALPYYNRPHHIVLFGGLNFSAAAAFIVCALETLDCVRQSPCVAPARLTH
jgi:hypothetical protein